MTYKLKIIIGSTRPSRQGHLVAHWFSKIAETYPEFSIEILDLKEINLPLMDEPHHPKFGNYTHEHTKKWSKTIADADAFVFVTPEYNYSFPAPLKNALDYLFAEWQHKPAAFVSYGGISGGTRSVQGLKMPVTTLGMMPLPEAVNIPFFGQHIAEGVFRGNEALENSARVMLKKLAVWTKTLKIMREKELQNL